jgi:hypothetical protein
MVRVSRRLAVVRASAVLAVLAVVAALALPGANAAVSRSARPAQPAPAGHTTCVTAGLSTTCSGTYSGNDAWDPTGVVNNSRQGTSGTKGAPNPLPPQVTVSQTSGLVNQGVQISWKNFTPSTQQSTWPPPPGALGQGAYYPVSVYECRGTNPQNPNYVNDGDCYDSSPEQALSGADNRVQDTFTLNNGTGEANFYVEAGSEINNFLNCDPSDPCSIVVVPNWGGEPQNCSNHSQDFADAGAPPFGYASPDFDTIWDNSPCGWADRIVVPLTFGPTPANCPQVTPEFYSEGSPMLERAMNQWIPGWCNGSSPLSLSYAFRTTEEQARTTFLQPTSAGTAPIDVAFTTLPPDAAATAGSTRKYTYAPVAVSAVAISYYIDDPQTHTPITHLVLDASLLAKLLTESYSLNYPCRNKPPFPWSQTRGAPSLYCDPAVVDNPATIFDDPEFLSLNAHCQPLDEPANYTCRRADFPADSYQDTLFGQFLPTVLAGNSDMTYELTRWIASNSDAMGFIDGKVDPYDMHVNENYINQAYPISQYATLDNGTTYPGTITCQSSQCQSYSVWYDTMQAAWNPVSGLDNVATDLAAYQPTALSPYLGCPSTVTCTSSNEFSLSKASQQGIGDRTLFSVVDEGDAGIFQFPTAYLVNAAGDAVAPTTASMQADVQDMDTNPDGITQYSNFGTTDPAAYPVTMVNYAMVPTCGLSSAKASAIAGFLTKVATSQTPGLTPGTLAPGYAPLDPKQRAQTLAAAAAVKSQDCKSAPPDNTVSGEGGVGNVTPPNGKPSAKAARAAPSPSSSPIGNAHTAAYGIKSPLSGLSGVLILLAVIFGVLLVLGGPLVWMLVVTGKWPVVLRWLRTALPRLRLMPGQLAALTRRS